jgi:hypothetical protein
MARYLVATHRATLVRDFLCKQCSAYGHATVEAVGKAEKRVWFSRANAADAAHDLAAEDLVADANRIVSLVRCPKCRSRAPGAALATLLHGFGDFATAIGGGLFAGIAVGAAANTATITLPVIVACVVFILLLAIGEERRRWSAAARADVQLARKSRTVVERTPAPPPRTAVTADPFRAPPAPPPLAVVRPEIESRAPIVPGDPSDKPTFLT